MVLLHQDEGQYFTNLLDEKLRVEEEEDYILRMATHLKNTTKKDLIKTSIASALSLTTNVEIAPQELYENYKQRNEIEVMFVDSYKNLKADRMYARQNSP